MDCLSTKLRLRPSAIAGGACGTNLLQNQGTWLRMKEIIETFGFFNEIRRQMRFGEYSRLPIRVHRFEICSDWAKCDWFMRSPDPWDRNLPLKIQEEHVTNQALADALKIRELIFKSFPQVAQAALRMYRESENDAPELMMIGDVERGISSFRSVSSLVMRAKLYGFRFSLACGALQRISPGET